MSLWLHSTKYDGGLHYRYRVREVERSGESLVTFAQPGVPIESYRGSWTAAKHTLSFFWRERPYVLHFRWNDRWQPEAIYVDIATATDWDDERVRYVDLDLDLVLTHGSSTLTLDDKDEFEANRVRWGYPADLVGRCWAAVEEVLGLFEKRVAPFTPALFAWRPEDGPQASHSSQLAGG